LIKGPFDARIRVRIRGNDGVSTPPLSSGTRIGAFAVHDPSRLPLWVSPEFNTQGFVAAPNRVAGQWLYQPITGDFDLRMRARLRTAANGELPSTNEGVTRGWNILTAHGTGAANWVESSMGTASTSSPWRRSHTSSDASGVTTTTTVGVSSVWADLRVHRAGQIFTCNWRAVTLSVPLSSDVGWAVRTFDRTGTPLNSTLQVGPNLRVSGVVWADTLAVVEEMQGFPVGGVWSVNGAGVIRRKYNYIHVGAGATGTGTPRVQWMTTDSNTPGLADCSAFGAANTTAPLDLDFRIVRRTADLQIFDLQWRLSSVEADLLGSVGWTTAQTINRSSNATPARSANGAGANLAIPFPDTVLVGPTVFSTIVDATVNGDIRMFVDEFRVRRPA
jgi:hypothetical protein